MASTAITFLITMITFLLSRAYSQTTLLFIQDSKKLEITHRLSRSTILYAYV